MTPRSTSDTEVRIACDDNIEIHARAFAIDGVWALTRAMDHRHYRVTHVPSGREVGDVYVSVEAALPTLRHLGAVLPTWERNAGFGAELDASAVLREMG